MTITGWRKSSRSMSNGQCVEAGNWRTSAYSVGNGSCVEAGSCGHGVAVRDSADRSGPALTFAAEDWNAFLASVKAAP